MYEQLLHMYEQLLLIVDDQQVIVILVLETPYEATSSGEETMM
jgi:hypothetical protein